MVHIVEKQLQEKIDAWDMKAVVDKFAKENSISANIADRYERELKRYFFMCAAFKKPYGMAGKVDELWHDFILHTREYSDFSEAIFGKYFHHLPEPTRPEMLPDPDTRTGVTMFKYIRFLVDYFRNYGEAPPEEVWPLSKELFGEVKDWDIAASCVACLPFCRTP